MKLCLCYHQIFIFLFFLKGCCKKNWWKMALPSTLSPHLPFSDIDNPGKCLSKTFNTANQINLFDLWRPNNLWNIHPKSSSACHCWQPHSIMVEILSELDIWYHEFVSPFSIIRQTSLTFHIMNVGFEMSCTYSNRYRKCQSTILRILNDRVVGKTPRAKN